LSREDLAILIRLYWSYFIPEVTIIPGNINFGPPAEKFIFHQLLPLEAEGLEG
jgi:hypothetical protein